MTYKPDNQLFPVPANTDIIPQTSRIHPAIPTLEYIQSDNDAVEPYTINLPSKGEYIPFEPVETAPVIWIPVAKTVAVVAVSGLSLYGIFLGIAFLVVQIKFWLCLGVLAIGYAVAENYRHPRRTTPDNYGQPNRTHPDTAKGQININVTHNGHGDVHIKIK